MTLRPYQRDAMEAVITDLASKERTLVSMPTGVGKTVLGAALADWWGENAHRFGMSARVLWLAHRDELVWQAARALELATGEEVAVEKGDSRARATAAMFDRRIVVGSVQTLFQEDRRDGFGHDEFGLIVADEAHHYVAPAFRDVIDYFHAAKTVGLTATTDRHDQISLGQLFEGCAYHYDVMQAIEDGWLCRLRQEYVEVEGLDWSSARKTGTGDLSATDIDRIINEEEVLHKIVVPCVRLAGNRPTLVFTPSVATAKAIAAIIPRYTKAGAAAICGDTPEEERRRLVDQYKEGHFQFLVNCMVLTEGFDAPATACIVMARPTNSRTLYAQAIGRGLRGGHRCPIPGKKDCLIVDLVGASLKHQLCTSSDILTGNFHEVVQEAARDMLREPREEGEESPDVINAVLAAIANEEQLRRERRKKLIAEAKLKRTAVDPFGVLAMPEVDLPEPGFWDEEFITEKAKATLEKAGVNTKGLTRLEGERLVRELRRRAECGICTFKQARHLRAWGFDPSMSLIQANVIISKQFARHSRAYIQPEDAKRRHYAKKRGQMVTYEELAWTPAWSLGEGIECVVCRDGGEPVNHRTTKRTHFKHGRVDGNLVTLVDDRGWTIQTTVDQVDRLK